MGAGSVTIGASADPGLVSMHVAVTPRVYEATVVHLEPWDTAHRRTVRLPQPKPHALYDLIPGRVHGY